MKIVALALIAVLLGGCSTVTPTATPRRLAGPEKHFDTGGPITSLFHASLYYPEQLDLRYDGYIVGIEKSPRAAIGASDDAATLAVQGMPLPGDGVRGSLNDGKRMFVSHVIRRSEDDDLPICALHNAYDKTDVKDGQFVKPCQRYEQFPNTTTAYQDSWKALQALSNDLQSRKGEHYTHIVVVTMGWNTDQVEAIRNVNTITHNLVKAVAKGAPPMRPLVIAVTWPGMWKSGWADTPVKIASFPNKAEDSDEVGLTWLGVLLHQTLPKAALGVPVIAIGHSFGGRATTVAACTGPAISDGTAREPLSAIDGVVILQGAFPTSRLLAEREVKAGQRAGCGHVRRLIMTASESDVANKLPGALWRKRYSGDSASHEHYCVPGQVDIRCAMADKGGDLSAFKGKHDSNVLYVDTSALMTENAYMSGEFSGSHSDIFRIEHAKFIWNALDAFSAAGTSASAP